MLTRISRIYLISINYISTSVQSVRASIYNVLMWFCYNHQYEDDDQSTSCDPKFSTKSCLCLICWSNSSSTLEKLCFKHQMFYLELTTKFWEILFHFKISSGRRQSKMQSTETFCRYLLDMLVLKEDFGSIESTVWFFSFLCPSLVPVPC